MQLYNVQIVNARAFKPKRALTVCSTHTAKSCSVTMKYTTLTDFATHENTQYRFSFLNEQNFSVTSHRLKSPLRLKKCGEAPLLHSASSARNSRIRASIKMVYRLIGLAL